MTDNEYKYWAFLNYSPSDNREPHPDTQVVGRRCWGNWLHDALKKFSIPAEFVGQINGRGEIIPERIAPIFLDESELSETATLSADVCQALAQSRCLIVICSPRSAQSRQMNEVVRYYKQHGRGKPILPIVVAGEPHASEGNKPGKSLADECFVPALCHPVSPDGTIDTTRRAGKSIFVDARHGVAKREILANDDRHAEADLEMAKIQLIALLLGVGFNGLWWREQKRHFIDLAAAQQQVAEVRRELQAAQRQTREAQNQVLEIQNLPRDIHDQIQAAQQQANEAQKQLQEFQNQVRDTQTQLAEARHRALAAESKVLEAQQQARAAQSQLEPARKQAGMAQNAQSQLEETRHQVQGAHDQLLAAQSQVLEFQNQARSAQTQLEAARQQVCEAQSQVLMAQNQVQAIQNQTQDAQSQIEAAQNQVRKIESQGRNARRLTKVFALLAVLAWLAAGMAASIAWRQRQIARQVFEPAPGELDREQIRQGLQKIGGAEQARHLDQLAAGISQEEISEALKASVVIVSDQQRSHFQKWLLIRLGWANPVSAMTCAGAIEGKIVNDDGLNDSVFYFQLAVLDNWMKTDFSGAFNWACQLPDADSRQRALDKIIHWVKSQPDSESKNKALENCIAELAKTDVPRALALAESLPEGAWRSTVMAGLSSSLPPEIMQPRTALWPWTKFLLNSYFGSLTIFSVETEILSNPTNSSIQTKPKA